MKHSIRTGFSFGATSGIITTIGLMIGLYTSTGSKLAVLGGILTIAVSDALSDAMGIHISEEAENSHTTKQIWTATISTFLFKFIFALSFIFPILWLSLAKAISISAAWGILLLSILSIKLAKKQKIPAYKTVLEHLLLAVIVITITYFVGIWVKTHFGMANTI